MQIEPHPVYELNPLLDRIALGGPVDLDLETTGLIPWKDSIRLIAIKVQGQSYLIQPEYYSVSVLRGLFEKIAKYVVIAHNAKFDAAFIYCHYGVLLTNIRCTLIASQLIQGGSRLFKHTLDNCISHYLEVTLNRDKKALQKSFTTKSELTQEQFTYAIEDVIYLSPLHERQLTLMEEKDLMRVYRLEIKLIPVLVKMESLGCLVDVKAWHKTLGEWSQTKEAITRQLDAEYMRLYPFVLFGNLNYSSPKQLIEFFKSLGLPAPTKDGARIEGQRKVPKKESVDEGALESYRNEHPNSPVDKFIDLLLQYRQYDKLLSTYGESFLATLDESDRVHTTYTQTSTTTGRLSSKAPNLQNIPNSQSGEGGKLRRFFIASDGYEFLTSDMSSAEVVLAADRSKDPLLMRSIREGADMHSELASVSASILFGEKIVISKSQEPFVTRSGFSFIPGEFRDISKSVHFSKFYKGGPQRIYEILARYINPNVPPKRRMMVAKAISEAIDRALPRLSKYLSHLIDTANEKGYLVTTKLGRRRCFDGKVYGEAANAPIQGSNADAMKIALVNIDRKLEGRGRILMTVHDEVCVEALTAHAEDIAKMVKEEMTNALSWQLDELEGGASVKINKYWEK